MFCRRSVQGGSGVRETDARRDTGSRRLRGTRPVKRVVLHVQHDMRSVRHDFGVQDSRGTATVGHRAPVVGVELRRQNSPDVFRGVFGRRPGILADSFAVCLIRKLSTDRSQ